MNLNTVEEQYLYTTLKIESTDDSGNTIGVGTGFLLSRPIDNNGSGKIYLVSNKHVLYTSNNIAITFTKKDVNINLPKVGDKFRIPLNNINTHVYGHNNPNVDIAVVEITGLISNMQDLLFVKWINYDMLSDFREEELSVAQNVVFVGYPNNRYDEVNNLPLIRNGMIASHPKYDYNGLPQFIIDAQVFPGSSGSPVLINLTYESWKTGNVVIGENKIKLLGVVAATMIRNNQLQSLNTVSISELSTQEVIGLGIVYKSTALKELIDSLPI